LISFLGFGFLLLPKVSVFCSIAKVCNENFVKVT
jgi:hypothetical protein